MSYEDGMFDSFVHRQAIAGESKIAMLVMDGLGGLPREPGGKTELETAHTPNLDALASRSALGLTQPVGPGITVGSGPGHLAIFGYDPLEYEIGRGALEALGVDFELGPDDVAARGNFCTISDSGILTDRRAGRLPSGESVKLVELLRSIKLDGVELFLEPIKEHRFAFIMRAPDLGASLFESDPLVTGVPPCAIEAVDESSQKSAVVANDFIRQAKLLLEGKSPANMVLLRGFARFPVIPSYAEKYKLHAAAIAVNGMYRGVARLAGMNVLPINGVSIEDEFTSLEKNWQNYDFFYLHYKKTDTCGESGDFAGKVRAIEAFDAQLPRLLALDPDVVVIGGDHSSPSILKSHSWHPVPVLLYSKVVRADGVASFGEQSCSHGSLGLFPAKQLMPLVLANAGRLAKYGA